MGDSVLFGQKRPDRPHILRGTGGIGAEIADLRDDVDEAFVSLEAGTNRPFITQLAGVADKDSGFNYGIANDADTTLALVGVNFNVGIGRDSVLIGDVAGINSGIRVVALVPGDPKIDVAFFDDVTAGAETCTYTLGSDGRHKIHIVYDSTGGGLGAGSRPTDIRAAVLAEATALGLIAVVAYTGGTGAGVITAGEISTLGATASSATSAYVRLGQLTTTTLPGADSVVVTYGLLSRAAKTTSFSFAGISTAARFTHSAAQYPISQVAAVQLPSDTYLRVLVDGDHAAFTATLTAQYLYPFTLSLDGYRSNEMAVRYVDTVGTSSAVYLQGVETDKTDANDSTMMGVADDADTTLELRGTGFDVGVGRDAVLLDSGDANTAFYITALNPGLSNIQLAFFDVPAAGAPVCTYTLIGGVHSIHFQYDSNAATTSPATLRTALLVEATATTLIAITADDGETGAAFITTAGSIDTLGATIVPATSAYIAFASMTGANLPGAGTGTVTAATDTGGSHTFEYAAISTAARFTHEATQYPISQVGNPLDRPSNTKLRVLVDSNHADFSGLTLYAQHTFRVAATSLWSNTINLLRIDSSAATPPVLTGIDSAAADANVPQIFGIDSFADTVLKLQGANFNAGLGRDTAVITTALTPNADFRIHAINPGTSNIQIAMIDTPAAGAITCTYTLIGGVHSIHFEYDNALPTSPAALRTALLAEATARTLITITGEDGGTGAGLIGAGEIDTLGATIVPATSAYVALNALTGANIPGAVGVVTAGAGTFSGYGFSYAGVFTPARFTHEQDVAELVYPSNQFGSLQEYPSDTTLMLAMDSNHADFSSLTRYYPYSFLVAGNSRWSTPVSVCRVTSVAATAATIADAQTDQIDKMGADFPGVANDVDTVLSISGTNFNAGLGRDTCVVDCAAANSDFRVAALAPGLTTIQVAFFDNAAEAITYTLTGADHQIHINYNGGVSTPTSLRTLLLTEATARSLIAITGADTSSGVGVIAANEIDTLGATNNPATSAYIALNALTGANIPGATGTVTAGTAVFAGYSFEYGGITTAALFIHEQSAAGVYPVDQSLSPMTYPSDGTLMLTLDGDDVAFAGLTRHQAYTFRIQNATLWSNAVALNYVDTAPPLPTILSVAGLVDKGCTGLTGIADDADATLRIVGSNFNGGVGRDECAIDPNIANTPFRITAIDPGITTIRLAFIENGAEVITYTLNAPYHDIHITLNGAASTVTTLQATLGAVAAAAALIAITGEDGSTSGGGILINRLDMTAATTNPATSGYVALGVLATGDFANLGAAGGTAVPTAATAALTAVHSFNYSGVATVARYDHGALAYPADQSTQPYPGRPSNTVLRVVVDGDNAEFTNVLPLGAVADFILGANGETVTTQVRYVDSV